MPLYSFSTVDGEIVERFFPMGEAPSAVNLEDGRLAERDFAADHVARPSKTGWPITCVASGVHPSQAEELRKYLKSHGVSTEVTSQGDPVYTSKEHRKRALKIRGFFDCASYC